MTEPSATPAGPVAPGADRAAGADAVAELVCSARGCRATADWGLLWNNPRLHDPARRKVWLACSAHREHLEQFLGARSFLRTTVPVATLEVTGAVAGADSGAEPRG